MYWLLTRLRHPMVVVASLVATSVGIVTGAVVWAWRNGTLGDTAQERYDHEFDRIVQRLRPLS